MVGIEWELEGFENWILKEEISEKGNARKHTGNRVTRRSKMFWRNFGNLR
jgi:hypothetical protein